MTKTVARLITRCPVGCTAGFDTTDIALPEGLLLRCRDCGQLVSQITTEAYERSMRAFNQPQFNLPTAAESLRRRALARRRLQRLAALLGEPPSAICLLDVGCSRGDFVADAGRLGFQATGVEPAPDIAAAARARGLDVRAGLLKAQRFADASFDAVTLFEVIEHLREPLPLLAECERILRPGGILLLSTGNAASWTARAMNGRWDYFQIEHDAGHVSFYNPGSIARLASRAGFAAEAISTSRVRLLEKSGAPRWLYLLAKLAAEALNAPARLAGKGHDMLVYLRRPA